METECLTCEEILALEAELNQRANALVDRVNELCRPVRERNKERWEKFARKCRLPLIGNLIFELYRGPKGLEEEPSHYNEEWYRTEGKAIEEGARELERMKADHMEHWGDELVEATFGWDYAGYYEHYHPSNPMPRRDAYKKYMVEGREESLHVWTPRLFDFSSGAGVDKNRKGLYVMDAATKKVVQITECGIICKASYGRLKDKFARTHATYSTSKSLLDKLWNS